MTNFTAAGAAWTKNTTKPIKQHQQWYHNTIVFTQPEHPLLLIIMCHHTVDTSLPLRFTLSDYVPSDHRTVSYYFYVINTDINLSSWIPYFSIISFLQIAGGSSGTSPSLNPYHSPSPIPHPHYTQWHVCLFIFQGIICPQMSVHPSPRQNNPPDENVSQYVSVWA